MGHPQILRLVFVFACDLVAPTIASTLIREGRLVERSRDTSNLTFGGLSPQNSAGNGCSWNMYYESCAGNGGTVVYKKESNGPSYNLNGNTVTYCSRYRRISSCTQSGTSIASTSYGGSKVTYELVSDSNAIAQLSILRELSDSCQGVCTDPSTALAFPLDSRANCEVGSGWVSVNDDFEKACASAAVCADLNVLKGCESAQKDIVGKYAPLSDLSGCSASDVDKTRSVYFSSASNKYLFYHTTKNEWIFNKFCSDLAPISAFLEAGEEPYLDTGARVECYDGGSGSSKRYADTDIVIQCNKLTPLRGESSGSPVAVSSKMLPFLLALVAGIAAV